MDLSNSADIQALRRLALELEFRAKCDPDFLDKLRAAPVPTLREAGFADAYVEQAADELQGTGGMSLLSAGPCGEWCDGITCIFTTCCFFTSDPTITMPPDE